MKKLLITIQLLSIMTLTASAGTLDTNNWFAYNGYSTLHSFSVKFPTDWRAYTIGDDLQGFSPTGQNEEEPLFLIREFEGQTFEQVQNYYLNENTGISEQSEILFQSSTEDLIGKKVIYLDNSSGEETERTLIKRGSLIVSLSKNSDKHGDILESIQNSFNFTDNWHQYMDFGEKYTFIFPSKFKIMTFNGGVEIVDAGDLDKTIFTVIKYEDNAIEDVVETARGVNQSYLSREDIVFHGISEAIKAQYQDTDSKKKVSMVFVSKDSDSYKLTDVNIEDNYPVSDYYNEYIAEMLESFEFFGMEIEGGYSTFTHFPDVRDNHINSAAINSLVEDKVINGYPDGTFKPDGEINRAELTKMIVATIEDKPDIEVYNNCFPDVKAEWFASYICFAKERGWVEGYPNGKFKPESPVNRVEALKIILEVLFDGEIAEEEILKDKSVLDVDMDEWYGKYFAFADNKNLLDKQHIVEEENNYSYFPNGSISRKEVAETIYLSRK